MTQLNRHLGIRETATHILDGIPRSVYDVMSGINFTFEDLWSCPEATAGQIIYSQLYKADGRPSGAYVGQTKEFVNRQARHAVEVQAQRSNNEHLRHARKASDTKTIKLCIIINESLLTITEQTFISLLELYHPALLTERVPSTGFQLSDVMPALEFREITGRVFRQVSWSGSAKRLDLVGLNW